MIKLGIWQELKIVEKKDFGVYLAEADAHADGTEPQKVLLPIKQVPTKSGPGDIINVFVYRDSDDRIISTVNEPAITLSEVKVLEVKAVTAIGAFLDWGLEKDLFLPYKEQNPHVSKGDFVAVALYIDKSDRLAATMWIDRYLSGNPDDRKKTKAVLKMKADACRVYRKLEAMQGKLYYDDKAEPGLIERDFHMSKNAFKKAVGILYKAGFITLYGGRIFLTDSQKNLIEIVK